jgi:hypothetical protein
MDLINLVTSETSTPLILESGIYSIESERTEVLRVTLGSFKRFQNSRQKGRASVMWTNQQ